MISPIIKLKHYYETFDQASFESLSDIYADDLVFIDPMHEIHGVAALKTYFNDTCSNLTYCKFTFTDEIIGENSACLIWRMEYSHGSLKNSARLSLVGNSVVQFSGGKVTSQEDFYDMGAMVYEHIPILGGAIRMVKTRITKAA